MEEVRCSEFENTVSKGIVVVDFWAPWCGPCLRMGPVLEEVSREMEGVRFIKLNVDNCKEIARKYGIMSIPTLVIFKDGKEIKRVVGALDKSSIEFFIESAIKGVE